MASRGPSITTSVVSLPSQAKGHVSFIHVVEMCQQNFGTIEDSIDELIVREPVLLVVRVHITTYFVYSLSIAYYLQ